MTVTDSDGLSAPSITKTVTVVKTDVIPPTITLLAVGAVELDANGNEGDNVTEQHDNQLMTSDQILHPDVINGHQAGEKESNNNSCLDSNEHFGGASNDMMDRNAMDFASVSDFVSHENNKALPGTSDEDKAENNNTDIVTTPSVDLSNQVPTGDHEFANFVVIRDVDENGELITHIHDAAARDAESTELK